MLETELKYKLSPPEYYLLLRHFKSHPRKKVRQANYYFDTNQLILKAHRIGLRLRASGEKKATLTIKFPHHSSKIRMKGLKIRKEIETRISDRLFNAILEGEKRISDVAAVKALRQFLTEKELHNLTLLGKLETTRTTVLLSPHFDLEIDRCKVFKRRFYEAEVETSRPRQADRLIRKLFKQCKIAYRPYERSKMERFYVEWTRRKPKLRGME